MLLATATLLTWLLWHGSLVYFPKVDEPRPVDVVYVLGPSWPNRVSAGVALVEAGYANTLVVSVNSEGPRTADELEVCTRPQSFEVLCLTPEPFTTQGEARDLARLASQEGWTSAIVVTMRPHVERARMYFERCVALDLLFVEDNRDLEPWRWVRQYVYEAGAWAKSAIVRDC